MIKSKPLFILIVFISLFFVLNCTCYSQTSENKEEFSKEFGVFSGWASGKLKYNQGNYEMVPLHFQLGFDITSLLENINLEPKGKLKFVFEPFLNTILRPNENVEAGNNFILKYSHPLTQRFSVYCEGGLGLLYTTQHTYEQGTQFNFSQHLGAGFSYLFSENKAINLGYRYRHFSNAEIEEPNAGIDMDFFLIGISVFY